MKTLLLLLLVAALVVSACSDGNATATTATVPPTSTTISAPPTTSPTTTTTAPTTTVATTTTTSTSTTTTTSLPTACPVLDPIPPGSVSFAPVGGDFDGDGATDVLETYATGDQQWRVRITFGDGGGADALIDDAEDFAPPRPIGGYDIDGDGSDEAFLTVGSGASTILIGFFDIADCVAIRITEGGVPAVFPIGASVGNVSGVSCPVVGEIHRNFAQYVSENEYEGGFEPFALEGSVLTAGPGDGAAFSADEAFTLAVLDCGDLALP